MKTLIMIVASAASLIAFANTASAQALNSNQGGYRTSTVGDLRGRGYDCRYVRGTYTCSGYGPFGKEVWVCDSPVLTGRCELARKAPSAPLRPKAPVQGPVMRLR